MGHKHYTHIAHVHDVPVNALVRALTAETETEGLFRIIQYSEVASFSWLWLNRRNTSNVTLEGWFLVVAGCSEFGTH